MGRLVALAALLLPQAAGAAACRDEVFDGASFTLCEVTLAEDLRLWGEGPDGPWGSFRAIDEALGNGGQALGFAMNAGMYHTPLVTRDGPGNFGLLPNGVFCWGAVGQGFRVIESRAFKAESPACRFATQSGPMLVIDGALHPKLLPDSDSFYIRNGVGVSADGQTAVFAISNDEVNFHLFARLFRDHLGLPDALYFDGNISRLYAPDLGRHDGGFPMGPIVGTVVPKG